MNIVNHANTGWIEVICGSMFSGKSEELIRRLRRASIARQEVLAFKPRIDSRYAEDCIASHSQQQIPCIQIEKASELLSHIRPATRVVGIDEVQFLGTPVVPICQQLADRGIRVICAGLDQDYTGKPWAPVPELLAVAEYVQKTLAICVVCGNPASRTQRKIASSELVVIGSAESYEARCRNCHTVDEPLQQSIFAEADQEQRIVQESGAAGAAS